MAATRLRRAFHYPTESDDEDAVEHGMDEQDQTHLISTLSAHDTSSTRLYTLLLSALPLVPALLHIPLLLHSDTFFPSLVAIASLVASAYALCFLPLPPVKVGIVNTEAKKGEGFGRDTHTAPAATKRERRRVPYITNEIADALAKYIIPANSAACVLLALLELWRARTWSEGVAVGGGYLPGFVLSVVLWARRELRVVDLGELEGLKFGGKAT